MFQHKYAASTTNAYVSAIVYCHRLAGFSDPTKVFFIKEMLKGYGKLGYKIDARLPITLPILNKILQFSSTLATSQYWTCLFNAVCVTSFFAFLRIGEITTTPQSSSVIQLSQIVKLVNDTGFITGFKLTFINFKHSYNHRRVSICLTCRGDICLAKIQTLYLSKVAIGLAHYSRPQTVSLFHVTHLQRT